MKRVLAIFAAVLIGLIVTGCGKKDDPKADQAPGETYKTKIQLNWVEEPEFGGIYAASLTDAFKKRKLDAEVVRSTGNLPVVDMVASGGKDCEFGVLSADEIVIARARGKDVVGIFAIYQTCPQGIMIHASNPAGSLDEVIKSGGKLSADPGLAYIKFLQHKYGGQQLQVVPYNNNIAPFLNDKSLAQQCFITAEPITAKRKGADVKVFLVADSGYNPYTAVIATRGEILRNKPNLVKNVVGALKDGWRAYLDDPAKANAYMSKMNTMMDAVTFDDGAKAQQPLIETAETKANGLGSMTEARWATLIQQLTDLKIIDKPVDAKECFRVIDTSSAK